MNNTTDHALAGASAYYSDPAHAANCSALLGCYLFEESRLVEADFQGKEVLYFCLGDAQWKACEGGFAEMLDEVHRQVDENDREGLRSSDLAEDWGVVADDAGQIVARALHTGALRKVRYLGREGGPLVTAPLTVQLAGIAWEPRTNESEPVARPKG